VVYSLVSQRPVIWYASVRENLDPHGTYTDQEIWSTLDQIGMGSAIMDLPDKLETILEDEGSLSTGQVFISFSVSECCLIWRIAPTPLHCPGSIEEAQICYLGRSKQQVST
jgi:hypothetical protein